MGVGGCHTPHSELQGFFLHCFSKVNTINRCYSVCASIRFLDHRAEREDGHKEDRHKKDRERKKERNEHCGLLQYCDLYDLNFA